jgi:ankyrin repeat protein
MKNLNTVLLKFSLIVISFLGINIITNAQDCKALCEAIKVADLTQMKELLRNGTAADCEYLYKYTPRHKNPYFRTKSFSSKRLQSPVHFIAQADLDYNAMLQLLKARGIDLNKQDNEGQTLLHLAATSKNEELLNILLNEKLDLNLIDKKGGTLLNLMIDNDTHSGLVQKFINKGALVAQSAQRNSALYQAFKHNKVDIARILLKNGASIGETNKQNVTCLNAAIENRNEQLINLAFEFGANLATADLKELTDEKLIKLLVQRGANPAMIDLNNIIAYTNNTDLVKWLLKNGVNPNQQGFLGRTPIYNAIVKDNFEILKMLVAAKGDLKHEIENGTNYLTIATKGATFNNDIIKFLLESGISQNGMHAALGRLIINEDMQSINTWMENGFDLSQATISNLVSLDFTKLLLQKGARINNFDLSSIVKKGNLEILQFLNEKGMKLEAQNAIYLAVKHQKISVLSYLLKEGFTPNLLYKEENARYTPIMKAILNRDFVSVKMLVEAGANVNTLNDKGETVLQMSILERDNKIIDYLLNNGIEFSKAGNPETILLIKSCIEKKLIGSFKKLINFGLDLQAISLADFMEDDNVSILEVLLTQDVDINTPNQKGQTPLFVAFKKRYYKTVRFLLEKGADINGICLAEFMEQQPRFDYNAIGFLIDKGINLNQKCNDYTPLEVAILKNDLDMIKYLLQKEVFFEKKKAVRFAKKKKASKTVLSYLKEI